MKISPDTRDFNNCSTLLQHFFSRVNGNSVIPVFNPNFVVEIIHTSFWSARSETPKPSSMASLLTLKVVNVEGLLHFSGSMSNTQPSPRVDADDAVTLDSDEEHELVNPAAAEYNRKRSSTQIRSITQFDMPASKRTKRQRDALSPKDLLAALKGKTIVSTSSSDCIQLKHGGNPLRLSLCNISMEAYAFDWKHAEGKRSRKFIKLYIYHSDLVILDEIQEELDKLLTSSGKMQAGDVIVPMFSENKSASTTSMPCPGDFPLGIALFENAEVVNDIDKRTGIVRVYRVFVDLPRLNRDDAGRWHCTPSISYIE